MAFGWTHTHTHKHAYIRTLPLKSDFKKPGARWPRLIMQPAKIYDILNPFTHVHIQSNLCYPDLQYPGTSLYQISIKNKLLL